MENSTGTDSTDSTSTPAEPGPADVSIPQLADVVLFKLLMTIDRDLDNGVCSSFDVDRLSAYATLYDLIRQDCTRTQPLWTR